MYINLFILTCKSSSNSIVLVVYNLIIVFLKLSQHVRNSSKNNSSGSKV